MKVTALQRATIRASALATFALAVQALGPADPALAADTPSRAPSETVALSCQWWDEERLYAELFLEFADGRLDLAWMFVELAPDRAYLSFPDTAEGSYSGGDVSASIPVVDGDFNPAGSATVSAALEDASPTKVINDSDRDPSNHLSRSTLRSRQLALAGTGRLVLPDGTELDLGGTQLVPFPDEIPDLPDDHTVPTCSAWEELSTTVETDPVAFVSESHSDSLRCSLDNGAATGRLEIDWGSSDGISHTEVRASSDLPTGDSLYVDAFFSYHSSDPLSNPLPLDVYDAHGNLFDQPAWLDLAVAGEGEPISYTRWSASLVIRASGFAYPTTGTLTFPGDVAFDLGHCFRSDETWKLVNNTFHQPSPNGLPPANDLPTGAEALTTGSRTTAQTKSASRSEEAPYECLPDGYEGMNTVWYRTEGTGSWITIDTDGTTFDTMIAVYTPNDTGGYDPLPGGCVDDIDLQPVGLDLQAVVTFDSVIGQTYFVQIGGAPADLNWGALHIAVR